MTLELARGEDLPLEWDSGVSEMREALANVLAAELVSSSREAESAVLGHIIQSRPDNYFNQQWSRLFGSDEVGASDSAARGSDVLNLVLPTIAAALASVATSSLATTLTHYLAVRGRRLGQANPDWFRPMLDSRRPPEMTTLTEFSAKRSQYVREVMDNKTPVLISRHGKVLAAIVPLVEGAFEANFYVAAIRDLHASNMAELPADRKLSEILTDDELKLLEGVSDYAERADIAASLGIEFPLPGT